jgi:hypothetical protein
MANDPQKEELTKDHLDFAWKTHDYIHNYIRFSDAKAALAITWCTAMAGAMCVAGIHVGLVKGQMTGFLFLSSLSGFILLGLAFLAAAWSIMPRLWTKQRSGLVFWESIIVIAHDSLYPKELGRKSVAELADHLAVQVYAVSQVASSKFFWSGNAIWLAVLGTVASVLAIALKAMA